ncbi:MAG: tetratricopeptide repeat protein [Allomuricauda sp.]
MMRINLQHILLLFFLLLFSCDLTSSGEYFNQARDLEIEGKYKEANALLNKAIEKNPKFRAALLNRAVNKSVLGDYVGAIQDYQKLLEFDSDNALALLNMGNNFKRTGDYGLAISAYDEALKTEWVTKEHEGDILALDVKISLQHEFDQDSEYEVTELEVIYERGIAYILNEQFIDGIRDMEKLVRDNYYSGDCYYWIGNAHVGLKDSTDACQNFIKSAKLGLKDAREKIKEHCLKNKITN